jgi:hypothetical protein
MKSVRPGGLQAGALPDDAVYVLDQAALLADQVMVIVADPCFVERGGAASTARRGEVIRIPTDRNRSLSFSASTTSTAPVFHTLWILSRNGPSQYIGLWGMLF